MEEFIKAYWPWIIVVGAVAAAVIFGAYEYLDAATSMLPGGSEGAGG